MSQNILSKILTNFGYFNNEKEYNTMHVLLIGAGGREHAIGWKLNQSTQKIKLFFAPGNAGTLQLGTNLNLSTTDFEGIINACTTHQIDMVVVGPEEPLVKGIVDALLENEATKHINIVGPNKQAAQLEGSKSFAKKFMQRHNIPTAAYQEFDKNSLQNGIDYIKKQHLPIVLKADGLAGGKGVIICDSYVQAIAEFEMMLVYSKFGEAGNKVVVEEFLHGLEFSVFALTDGKSYKILPIAKDYKRVGEGDVGLNTGGMGAVSPVPFVSTVMYDKVLTKIVEPTINGLVADGINYKGFVFFGLISVNNEPYIIEYNCRLGDPETEAILPRLTTDLLYLFNQLPLGTLHQANIEINATCSATIVATSGGYPNYYNIGYVVNGLTQSEAPVNAHIFVSGAKLNEQDNIITDGGRVIAVTGMGSTITDAVANSKKALATIRFEEMYYRNDIGYEFDNSTEIINN